MASQTHAHDESYLVYLDIEENTVNSITVTGKEQKVLIKEAGPAPDGVQLDPTTGRIFWSCMGVPASEPNGSIRSATLDGSDLKILVSSGKTHTPKQLQLSKDSLFWCDREGGRIQTCKKDGSDLKTLYDSAPGKPRPLQDKSDHCVGITIDPVRDLVYFTQKGPSKGSVGRLFRMPLEHSSRPECLFHNMPEPIDLELDENAQILYWTDRGDPPYGNTVNKSVVSGEYDPARQPGEVTKDNVVATHFHETIGLAIDTENKKGYVSDLKGTLWEVTPDGGKKAIIRDAGNFTGIAFHKGSSS